MHTHILLYKHTKRNEVSGTLTLDWRRSKIHQQIFRVWLTTADISSDILYTRGEYPVYSSTTLKPPAWHFVGPPRSTKTSSHRCSIKCDLQNLRAKSSPSQDLSCSSNHSLKKYLLYDWAYYPAERGDCNRGVLLP